MYNKFEKGAVWRKWDLHFHAPSKFTCAKNDQYYGTDLDSKFDHFLEQLKAVDDISVAGITDYFSLDGYKKVLAHAAHLENFELILPNIELRISPVTTDNRKINLHIIPNTLVLSVEEIERFLFKFEFGPERYTCSENDLIKLGKQYLPDGSDEQAFKRGLNEFHISYDTFFLEFNKLSDRLRDNILIGVSNNSGDGASGIKDVQGIRDIIYAGVDFIFSAQPKDRIYFLGKGPDSIDVIMSKYGKLLPCLHGSDFHGEEDGRVFCVPDLNRFCWVKSDPTFEGLKQVMYEPEDRVSIQPNIPEDKTGYQIIDHIIIESDLIHNNRVLFNPNLNSIIGGRSSGKSVLIGAIAKKLKSASHFNWSSKSYEDFVESISESITVIWKDEEEANGREIEYFEQGYMYEIARNENKLNEIVKTILTQKGKENLLSNYDKYKTENSKALSGLVSDFFRLLDDINVKTQKVRDKGDKKGIEDEIKKLKVELEILSPTAISDVEIDNYKTTKLAIDTSHQKTTTNSRDKDVLQSLMNLKLFKESLEYELTSMSENLKNDVIALFNNLKEEFIKKWKAEIKSLDQKLGEEIKSSFDNRQTLITGAIYQKVLKAYEKNTQLFEIENKIKVQNEKLIEITALAKEIESLKKQLEELKLKIISNYKGFFTSINELLPQLYNSKDELEIKAEMRFNNSRYYDILSSGLNLQSHGNQQLANYLYVNYNSFEEHQISIFDQLCNNLLTLKSGVTNQNLITALFSTNFFDLNYDIEYEGDEFNKMSDGKKAFVVLKLLLDFSDKDCPILIDQPEDDLDNRAIYNDLVRYIRLKKKKRQIIVATHNPNIVVGADSELIICANQNGSKNLNNENKKFQYVSGSIEHSFAKNQGGQEILNSQGIREHVCEVLEGGNIAFKLREKKYSIK